ncbi:hypothetical protein ACA910_016719 [Epithemia clementina (nom. ined.)]
MRNQNTNTNISTSNNEIIPLFLDHAETPAPPSDEEPKFRGGLTTHFPVLLHAMLTKAETDGYSDACCWEPHGRAFSVHNRDKFVKEVLPLYFGQTHFSSFQRQLNLYGFDRVSLHSSMSPGAYYHTMFLRTRQDLCRAIQRISTERDSNPKTTTANVTTRPGPKPKPKTMHTPDPDFTRLKAMPPSGPEHLKLASSVTIPRRRKSAPAKMETPPGSSNSSSSSESDNDDDDDEEDRDNHDEDQNANKPIGSPSAKQKKLTKKARAKHSSSPVPSASQQVYQQDLAVASREKKRKLQTYPPASSTATSHRSKSLEGLPLGGETTILAVARASRTSKVSEVGSVSPPPVSKTNRRSWSAPAKMKENSKTTMMVAPPTTTTKARLWHDGRDREWTSEAGSDPQLTNNSSFLSSPWSLQTRFPTDTRPPTGTSPPRPEQVQLQDLPKQNVAAVASSSTYYHPSRNQQEQDLNNANTGTDARQSEENADVEDDEETLLLLEPTPIAPGILPLRPVALDQHDFDEAELNKKLKEINNSETKDEDLSRAAGGAATVPIQDQLRGLLFSPQQQHQVSSTCKTDLNTSSPKDHPLLARVLSSVQSRLSTNRISGPPRNLPEQQHQLAAFQHQQRQELLQPHPYGPSHQAHFHHQLQQHQSLLQVLDRGAWQTTTAMMQRNQEPALHLGTFSAPPSTTTSSRGIGDGADAASSPHHHQQNHFSATSSGTERGASLGTSSSSAVSHARPLPRIRAPQIQFFGANEMKMDVTTGYESRHGNSRRTRISPFSFPGYNRVEMQTSNSAGTSGQRNEGTSALSSSSYSSTIRLTADAAEIRGNKSSTENPSCAMDSLESSSFQTSMPVNPLAREADSSGENTSSRNDETLSSNQQVAEQHQENTKVTGLQPTKRPKTS